MILIEKEVIFLGTVVGKNGTKQNLELKESIKEWKIPQTTWVHTSDSAG